MSNSKALADFSVELFKINAIKFGEFKTKVGLMTPVYFDLRAIISYPKLLDSLANIMVEQLQSMDKYNVICGVPYTALPIATVLSMKTSLPMVMRRKEAKDYGTKKLIEGVFNEGDKCLIIEDVITSGSSILETVKDLSNSSLKCSEAIVLVDRQQGGVANLLNNGIKTRSILTLTQLMIYLKEAKCIDDATVEKVKKYLETTQVNIDLLNKPRHIRLKTPFEERAAYAKNQVAKELFQLMATKQTNLCLAADVVNSTDLLNLAEAVGPHICALKLHIDIIEDFHPNLIEPLKDISNRHNFLLFEDRKFADIGNTVKLQLSKGIYQISSWAKLLTAHSISGKGVLDAIKSSPGIERGVFLIAQLSSSGVLIDDGYVKKTVAMAEEYPELIAGLVCQSPLMGENLGIIQLTPGVKLDSKVDDLGQQYDSPENVINEKGADVAVVGRGITEAANPAAAAEEYKKFLWKAYLKRIGKQ